MKLSKRLSQIDRMIASNYTHIWDCCCDHGFLGAALLDRNAAKHIHFVDIVPKLMTTLENKLEQFYASCPSEYYVHCIDVAKLPLSDYKGKHLVVIAGVGGDLMMDFVSRLCQRYPQLDIDFLLCPVHHQYALRQTLIESGLRLLSEALVEDNRRFYEVMLVTTNPEQGDIISSVGKEFWQTTSSEQTETATNYLDNTLRHYERIQRGGRSDVTNILQDYRQISVCDKQGALKANR
ncbi:tRNA (adenine(22)-N(1))-methyltransferase [Vibrio nomapromontoriensis]|uniref:tRNA (adenine(22)-N(1))-methyltransferase n=1 Tax=Vibrio nomapromontoriensis TaxID=2910246 RepID=UPI003D111F21